MSGKGNCSDVIKVSNAGLANSYLDTLVIRLKFREEPG